MLLLTCWRVELLLLLFDVRLVREGIHILLEDSLCSIGELLLNWKYNSQLIILHRERSAKQTAASYAVSLRMVANACSFMSSLFSIVLLYYSVCKTTMR